MRRTEEPCATQAKRPVARALLSVSDKTGLAELAQGLHGLGVELLATGGTYRSIAAAGVPATEVADYTGFPELLNGRVKTLHPKVHGGILARRGLDEPALQAHAIAPIDLVAVNLYPFAATVARPDCTEQQAIENIDIGGPAMLRSAAKNHRDVLVLADPSDYGEALAALHAGGTGLALRRRLALKAFRHTAQYDAAVARYLARGSAGEQEGEHAGGLPDVLKLAFAKRTDLRYGENPHQQAAFYALEEGAGLAGAELLQGKPLSYNNIADLDAALQCVAALAEPACVIVKHANPCGVAQGASLGEAYARAFAADPTSAFGGVIAFNRPLDGPALAAILENQFVEAVAAPALEEAAVETAKQRENLRLLTCRFVATEGGARSAASDRSQSAGSTGEMDSGSGDARGLQLKTVGGGLLAQTVDPLHLDESALKVVTKRRPGKQELRDLLFAWKVAAFVKSNAIVFAKDGQTVGIGAGQTSRVMSVEIAVLKAQQQGLPTAGAVMASDAFFPFRDGLDAAEKAGIAAIIQPGGSVRDQEVIEAANEHGMAMLFTGVRHFRH